MAATYGSSDTMGALIQNEANLMCKDREGNNIVHLLVLNNKANLLQVSAI